MSHFHTCSTTAPAPSPNKMHTFRSLQSIQRVSASAPTTTLGDDDAIQQTHDNIKQDAWCTNAKKRLTTGCSKV